MTGGLPGEPHQYWLTGQQCFCESLDMFQEKLLQGKRILITGGGTGLGRAMAEKYLQLGAEIYICGRRQNMLDDTARELKAAYGGLVKTFAWRPTKLVGGSLGAQPDLRAHILLHAFLIIRWHRSKIRRRHVLLRRRHAALN